MVWGKTKSICNVDWWNGYVGEWQDLGEATNQAAAVARIQGLRAADNTEPRVDQRYRVRMTVTIEILKEEE